MSTTQIQGAVHTSHLHGHGAVERRELFGVTKLLLLWVSQVREESGVKP